MKLITSTISICILAVIAVMIVFAPEPCEHEDMVEMYSFTSYNSTAQNSVRNYCRDCDERFQHQLFKGTLVDQSYLEVFEPQIDGGEIVPGEYYTITALVTRADYGFGLYDTPNVCCKLENEEFIVYFDVEFKAELNDIVKSITEDDIITFRGRFYDTGCGFADCELIEINHYRIINGHQ